MPYCPYPYDSMCRSKCRECRFFIHGVGAIFGSKLGRRLCTNCLCSALFGLGLKRLLARMTFCKMSCALAVKINGLGWLLCYIFINGCNQFRHTSRRSPFSEMSRKTRSTIFSHDAEVGVKCMLKQGCFSSHFCTLECLCVA